MKPDDIKAPKVDKNNWVMTMENIVTYLKLVRGMRGDPLAYVVQHHITVAHISPRSDAYLNLNEEMITRAPIVDACANLKLNQDSLDRAYLDHQADTFMIDNAMVYQILSKMFTYTNIFAEYSHQEQSMVN